MNLGTDRGASATLVRHRQVAQLTEGLSTMNPTIDAFTSPQAAMSGSWELVYTTAETFRCGFCSYGRLSKRRGCMNAWKRPALSVVPSSIPTIRRCHSAAHVYQGQSSGMEACGEHASHNQAVFV